MEITTILLVAVALAMDAFAVAVAAGFQLEQLTGRHIFRLSWHFGLFQALMPVIGWFAGRGVVGYIEDYAHWTAFFLLFWIGANMIRESFGSNSSTQTKDPTRGARLVFLSIATSMDALAVGFSLAALKVSIVLPVVIIGVTALVFTWVGLVLGNRVLSSRRVGKHAELIGGCILILIGINILHEHNVF
jgi:putative Mn2+ efflux pump MntP